MTYLRVIAIGTICIVAGIGLAAGQTKKPPSSKTGASADTITRKQADTIINELRQIRRLLETDPVPVAPVATARRPPQQARMNVSPRWFAMGRDDAPVTIVEFTDLQCPFCRSFHTDAFAELKNRYIDTGKVRFVSRDLPLSSHPYAASAALAVRCAGEQGKFWEMRESLITHANDLAAESVTRYAGEVGLDRANFKQCVDSVVGQFENPCVLTPRAYSFPAQPPNSLSRIKVAPVSDHKCPKCSAQMAAANDVFSLPLYLDPKNRPVGDRERVSTTAALAIRPYRCQSCDYVELYQA